MTKNQILELLPIGDPLGRRILFDPISAVVGGISAGTSLIGGILGKKSANKAAQIQKQAADKAAADAKASGDRAGVLATTAAGNAARGVQQATGDANKTLADTLAEQRGLQNPYVQSGQTATQGLMDLAGMFKPGGQYGGEFSFDPTKIADDPGYQFQVAEGMKALQRAQAARGQVLGGGAVKDALRFSQGVASTSTNDAFRRALETFNANRENALRALSPLSQVAQMGQNGANALTGALSNYGSQASSNIIGAGRYAGDVDINAAQFTGSADMNATKMANDAIMGGANAQAAGKVGGTNALVGGLTGVANAGQNAYLMSQLQPMANSGNGSYFPLPGMPGMLTDGRGGVWGTAKTS